MGVQKETTSENKISGILIWAIIIGLMFGFYIGRAWEKSGKEKLDVQTIATTTQSISAPAEESAKNVKLEKEQVSVSKPAIMAKIVPPKTFDSGTGILAVEDQDAGNVVFVAKVFLSRASWVVIREDFSGEMGKILGATRLSEGIYKNVLIELLRPTLSGKKYYAVLYNDNGDKKFSVNDDLLIKGTEKGFVAK